MRTLGFFIVFVFLLENCISLTPGETHTRSSRILQRIPQILSFRGKLSLLLYSPPELQSNLCNQTDEFLESLSTKGDALFSSVLLDQFQGISNFSLIDSKSRKFALQEQKFQMLGLTQTDVVRIGVLTGANFIMVSSSILDCTAENKELFYEKTTRLIQTETGALEAIDRTSLTFKWNGSKKQFEFREGRLNEEKISFPSDFF